MTIWEIQDLAEEFNRVEKDRLQWLIAASPESPDIVVGKYNAIQKAEDHRNRMDTAMDIVARMKGTN